MLRKDRYQYVLDYFRQEMPRVTTELEFGSAFQLLVATLLSAQCTDKRINMVTPALLPVILMPVPWQRLRWMKCTNLFVR